MVSQEDLRFIKLLETGISKDKSGHLMMPLPFKTEEPPILPNNRKSALIRLSCLKRKFEKSPQYRDDYKSFMADVIARGDAEEVSDEPKSGITWYIPHHGVYHPKKPKKIRVVFDCSAQFETTSLNSHLLTGPDQMNSLSGILWRFREKPVAVVGDIEKMFHQFLVNEDHRDYLRFLWWENGDVNSKVKEYRMKVHLFGAASSPGCANFGLKYLAKEEEKEFPSASKFILENFYVDDGLQSCTSEDEAINLI